MYGTGQKEFDVQQVTYDDIPPFLMLTAAQRKAAWDRNPPKAAISTGTREMTPEQQALADEIKATAKLKRQGKKEREAAFAAAPAIDHSKMRWCARTNRFIPIDGRAPPAKKSPGRSRGK